MHPVGVHLVGLPPVAGHGQPLVIATLAAGALAWRAVRAVDPVAVPAFDPDAAHLVADGLLLSAIAGRGTERVDEKPDSAEPGPAD